jgi:hypothetical protein
LLGQEEAFRNISILLGGCSCFYQAVPVIRWRRLLAQFSSSLRQACQRIMNQVPLSCFCFNVSRSTSGTDFSCQRECGIGQAEGQKPSAQGQLHAQDHWKIQSY